MRVNTSVRLLVIASAFLSAKAALAQNSFLPAQVLVAKNTLKTQQIDVNSLSSLTAGTVSTDRIDRVIDEQPDRAARAAVDPELQVANNPQQFGFDEDRAPTDIQPLPSRNLTSAHAQGRVFNSDVANLDRNSQLISGVPSQIPSSEASVEIFVPAPRTQTIKVPTVARLPRAAKRRIPTVMAIPVVQSIRTIAPSPNKTQFTPAIASAPFEASQPIDVPQPSNNVPTVPSLPTGSQAELIYPLMNPARTTSRFGWRTHPLTGNRRFHSGIDIGAPSGTPVVATATGTVISAGWNGGYGKAIVIQHNDSQQTLYGHLSEISVQPGQQIAQGSVIGLVGSTGNSTGPHLHFEVRSPGANGWVAVDPTQDIQYAVDNLRRSMPYAGKDNPQGL
ncbi:M23 family metallopeptidase [Chamaesiphon sp. OTE_20_metabat_361]|uniref:M23 family metallopeptidase n=1 Tax=Chamaesiphon sp. OTE_20_metabat_361 TaxID=2964689 RepID=UPI00286C87DC|nr:M23 family metallopeptidase [Chamaesiphon sp. OTE_20_metabat_361]